MTDHNQNDGRGDKRSDAGVTESELKRLGLMDPEDEAALLELAFQRQAARDGGLDEFTRQRLWRRLEARLSDSSGGEEALRPREMSQPVGRAGQLVGPLAAAAILLIALGSQWRRLSAPFEPAVDQRIKGPGMEVTPLPVRLSLYRLGEGGRLEAMTGSEVRPGATVVPQVELAQPANLALVVAEDGGQPAIRLRTEVPSPGLETPLRRDGELWAWQVEAGSRGVTICVLATAAGTQPALPEPDRVPQLLEMLRALDACRDLTVRSDEPGGD